MVHSFQHRMSEYLERMSKYDLLFGVASADSFVFLNEKQIQYGVETEERNDILSEFVSSTYKVRYGSF